MTIKEMKRAERIFVRFNSYLKLNGLDKEVTEEQMLEILDKSIIKEEPGVLEYMRMLVRAEFSQ